MKIFSALLFGLFLLAAAAALPGCFLLKPAVGTSVVKTASSPATMPFGSYVGTVSYDSSEAAASTVVLRLNADGTYTAASTAGGDETGIYSANATTIIFQSSNASIGTYAESYFYSANNTCLFLGVGVREHTLALYLRN
jgi:hypothetical protein